MTDSHDRPTTNQPLNAEPRRRTPAVAAVVGLVVAVLAIILVLTVVRYGT